MSSLLTLNRAPVKAWSLPTTNKTKQNKKIKKQEKRLKTDMKMGFGIN